MVLEESPVIELASLPPEITGHPARGRRVPG